VGNYLRGGRAPELEEIGEPMAAGKEEAAVDTRMSREKEGEERKKEERERERKKKPHAGSS
jgi:hypothetical protein